MAAPGPAAAVVGLLLAALLLAGCGNGSAEGPEAGHDEHGHEAAAAHDDHHDGEHGEEHDDHDDHGDHGDHHEDGHDSDLVTLDPRAVERAGIATTPARMEPLPEVLDTTGKVGYDERHLAHVTPRLPGRVQRVVAELGDEVAGGEALALLDSVVLGEAKATYLRARAREEVARSHAERERRLFAESITAEQVALEAEAHAREAAAELAAAGGTLRLYGIDRAAMEGLSYDDPDLSLLVVRAPFAGRVVDRDVALGEMVEAGDVLFTLADLSRVWVWLDLYERDLRHVAVGDPVHLEVDSWPGHDFTGEVTFLGDEVDPDTRTVRARVDLANPDRRLRPGMFARVSLSRAGSLGEPVLTIPRQAVQRGDEGPVVFVALADPQADGDAALRFRRQPVRLGRRSGDRVEVLDGLEPGVPVVTEGAFLLESQASSDQLGGHHH